MTRRWWRRDVACQELVELVTAYVEGTLPRRLRRAIEAHIAGCDPCAEYVAQIRATVAAVGSVGVAEPPPTELLDRLADVFERQRRA